MKKYILILITAVFYNTATSQVLYSESFDNFTLGNVGTDPTGVIPGKGGWLTECTQPYVPYNNNLFTINSEANKGNVLTLALSNTTGSVAPSNSMIIAKKMGLELLIDQRTLGNNVLKFEIDYYTGGVQQQFNSYGQHIIIGDNAAGDFWANNKRLINYIFFTNQGSIGVYGKDLGTNTQLDKNSSGQTKIPFNTWITLIVYLDYNNKKAYFETPYFNTIAVADFLKKSTSTNLIEDFKPTVLGFLYSTNSPTVDNNKYDNIKITALKSVPPYVLSAENLLAGKFNVFPNPATNVVNITNTDNLFVEKATVYDIAGKEIKNQRFTNETNIQLNVENLATGTYVLHLQTNEGLAVKKLVKK